MQSNKMLLESDRPPVQTFMPLIPEPRSWALARTECIKRKERDLAPHTTSHVYDNLCTVATEACCHLIRARVAYEPLPKVEYSVA